MKNSAMYRVVSLAASGALSLVVAGSNPVVSVANELGNALPFAEPTERLYG